MNLGLLLKLKPLLSGKANYGYCPICKQRTVFVEAASWLRDNYFCSRCQSIPRNRALISLIDRLFPDFRQFAIHESSPCGPASDKIARECPGYLSTQYFPGVPLGALKHGVRNENLEKMTYPDNCFDLTVTQDVMEHVLNPDRAFAEIARTLKPGGAHVFTVPLYNRSETKVRAVETAQGVKYLDEQEYHGNPVDAAGSLVVREWGLDLPDYIYRSSGMSTATYCTVDRKLGIDGEFLEVFVSRKPATQTG